jgi:hypothetical protein
MLESYITVLAWIFFPLSVIVALCQAVFTYKTSYGKQIVIKSKTSLLGILSFAWLVVRYSAFIKVAIIWTLIGIGALIVLFLIAYFVTMIFEHINKTNRIKKRMLNERKK